MKNTMKALSKQLFGARYEGIGKSLLSAGILFIAVHAAEFQVVIAPFILYLTSAFLLPASCGRGLWDGGTGRPCRG